MKQKVLGESVNARGTPKQEKPKPVALSKPKPTAVHGAAAPDRKFAMIELTTGPRPFSFDEVRDAAPGKECVSPTVRMKDLPAATPIGVVGRGSYRINRGPWLNTESLIKDGDLLQLMLKPSDTGGASRRIRVWVGRYYTDFKVFTLAE